MAEKKQSQGASPSKQAAENELPLEKLIANPSKILQEATPLIAKLVEDCLFVLDTNALLAPYDIGATSYADIDRIVRQLAAKSRLFVPEQVLREYLKNRESKLRDAYDHIHKASSNLAKKELSPVQLPMLENKPEYTRLLESLLAARESIGKCRDDLNAIKSTLKDWSWDDPISTLYGESFTEEVVIVHPMTLDALRKDAEWREKYKLPPGYKDKTKADGGLGDLIVWHTVLELGRSKRANVVFVTNERKQDWWVRSNEELLMPRQELCLEFRQETDKHFGMISFAGFLKKMGAEPETVEKAEERAATTHSSLSASAEGAVFDWLSGAAFVDQIAENRGFPDFVVTMMDQTTKGVEVMLARSTMSRIGGTVVKARQAVTEGRFDKFMIIVVCINDAELERTIRVLEADGLTSPPPRVDIVIGKSEELGIGTGGDYFEDIQTFSGG